MNPRIVIDLRKVAAFLLPTYAANPQFPLLVCLYGGRELPRFAEPMPRSPRPPLGDLLDGSFPEIHRSALLANPELHDGAILARRPTESREDYIVTGWSYRLFPPPAGESHPPNRGSAFHSCRAMSALPEVDGLLLFARSELMIFATGGLQACDPVA